MAPQPVRLLVELSGIAYTNEQGKAVLESTMDKHGVQYQRVSVVTDSAPKKKTSKKKTSKKKATRKQAKS